MKTFYFDIIDSTNTEAKRILKGESPNVAKAPFVIVANAQTAGRGRQGKTFYSPADTGIYMSVAINMTNRIPELELITVKTAVIVANAIKEVTGIETGIKWVNDLYLNNKKVCGILAESVNVHDLLSKNSDTYVIIGIGINLSTKDFPEDIRDIAGSLGDFDLENCKKKICENIISNISQENIDISELLIQYKKRSIVLNNEVTFCINDVYYTGVAYDINEKGELLVREANGNEHVLNSGEISLRKW